jgi:L-aspartate oxidase
MAGGIDPRRQPIPVAPACHYHMGGVATDADGATSLPGLFAAGEVASTGVHGANRLASNSLLEAAVFGKRAGEAARDFADPGTTPLAVAAWPDLPPAALHQLRQSMSRHAGVMRDGAGLATLAAEIEALKARYGEGPVLAAAELTALGALERRESRGAHFRTDYPLPAEPVRTFTTLTEAQARRALRFAAE